MPYGFDLVFLGAGLCSLACAVAPKRSSSVTCAGRPCLRHASAVGMSGVAVLLPTGLFRNVMKYRLMTDQATTTTHLVIYIHY